MILLPILMTQTLNLFEREHLMKYGCVTEIAIPLVTGDQIWGILEVWESRERREYSEDELNLVKAIAQQAASSLANAKLHERLKDSESRYRDLFENAHDMIVMFDKDGCLSYANQQWLHTMSYQLDDLAELHFEDILHADQRFDVHRILTKSRQATPVTNYPLKLISNSGKMILVEANFTPYFSDGQLQSVQAIMRDVTKRTQDELKLQKYMAELESRNRELDAYSHTIAHSIKNPLNAILWNTKVLSMETAESLPSSYFRSLLKN